jgi:chromosome segregation ATPase
LEKKDDEIRSKNRAVTEKELDLQEKSQELNERERNLDRTALSSAKEYDSKYAELQSKIDSDLADLSKREKELELGFKNVKELESKLESKMNEITELNKSKIYSDLEAELRAIEAEVRNIDSIANTLTDFNHPVIAQVGGELTRAISKLKDRVDNNLID